jgi:phosphomannomutase
MRWVKQSAPTELLGAPVMRVNELDGVKCIAADDSWLMLRASGTEPITRIYCETTSATKMRRLLEWGRGLVTASAT